MVVINSIYQRDPQFTGTEAPYEIVLNFDLGRLGPLKIETAPARLPLWRRVLVALIELLS